MGEQVFPHINVVFQENYFSEYKININQGGTWSGKTYSIMQVLLLKAVEAKRIISVIGQDIPNLKVGPYRDIQNILATAPEIAKYVSGHNRGELKFVFLNGSEIEFKSYDNAQDAKSGRRDIAFFNEANGIKSDVFDEIEMRTRETVYVDFNPNAHFWIEEVKLRPDAVTFVSTFDANIKCPQNVVDSLLRSKEECRKTIERLGRKKGILCKACNRWLVYGRGKYGYIEGAVYQDINWISEWPENVEFEKFAYGLDYGYVNDPLALIRAGLYKGEIYAERLLYATGMKTENIVSAFEELEIDYDDIICMDDSQAKEIAERLRDVYGYNILSARKAGGSILGGIDLLQNFKMNIVFCDDWKEEQEKYVWQKIRGEWVKKPVDKFNHLWDAIRYWGLELLNEPILPEYEHKTFSG